MSHPRKAHPRLLLAVLVALCTLLGTLIGASASSLGGVTNKQLGADTATLIPCDPDDVTAAYTNTWDATISAYRTVSVVISGIAATCVGQVLSVTFADGTGVSLGAGTLTVSATSHTITLSPRPRTDTIAAVSLVITG